MMLLNLRHLYMGISRHSGISSWLGQKECKSGVELLFSRKITSILFCCNRYKQGKGEQEQPIQTEGLEERC